MKYLNTKPSIDENGFTIIELLIATMIFSLVLLVMTIAITDISKTYYRGVTEADTYNTTRNIINNISQAIQVNGGSIVNPITPSNGVVGAPCGGGGAISCGFCVGSEEFSYLVGYELEPGIAATDTSLFKSPHSFVTNTVAGCNSTTLAQNLASTGSLASGSRELLSPNMRLAQLSLSPVGTNSYNVGVRILFGDLDLLTASTGSSASCNGQAGSQFCAVSQLSTVVQKRVQ